MIFIALVLAVSCALITWAFRSAQVRWSVRLFHKLGVVALVSRAYLIRSAELERGWSTNFLLMFFLVSQLAMFIAVIIESGLVGPRRVAPRHVK